MPKDTTEEESDDEGEWSLTTSSRNIAIGRSGREPSIVLSAENTADATNTPRTTNYDYTSNMTHLDESTQIEDEQLGVLKDFLMNSLAAPTNDEGHIRPPKQRPSLMSKNRHSSADIEVGSTIFETIFDLTEDRLRRLFHLFDESNSGTISYKELQLGFAYHFGVGSEIQRMSQLDDDQAFRVLVEYLDADKSGEITFEEFSEGIRLLILRSILQEVHYSSRSGGSSNSSSSSSDSSEDTVLTEVFDYNSIRFERYLLKGSGQLEEQQQARNCSFTICSKSLVDFFLQPRQDKVSVRWINISGKKASNIMKLMALKYRLHPLALQDALEHTVHRPKADSYDRHYFIMVPVFYWKGGNEECCNNQKVSSDTKTREPECNWWCGRFSRAKRKSGSGDKDYDTATDDDKSIDPNDDIQDKNLIGLHTTSIFITKPCGRTVITFNNEANDDGCWYNLQNELRMDYSKLRQYDGQHLAYRLLDEAVDKIEEIVKKLKAVFQREKRSIIQDNYKNLDKIHSLKQEMHSMSRKFKPFLRLLVHVIEDDSFSPEATIYLRDVLDNLEIHDEDVKSLIAKCESVDEEAEKLQAKKMDATLYTLTVVSAVFLPAQFLTGLWGMNFQDMPELKQDWGYEMFWIACGTSVAITIVFLYFERRHR